MRRLIVNADDFGVGAERNRGIIGSIERGVVTSASILANMPMTAEALAYAKGRDIGAGVHLNLTKGTPLTSGCATLVDGTGRFPGRQGLLDRLRGGGVDLAEARRELEAQVRLVLDAGVKITHIDGHQHVHVYPGLPEVAAEVARGAGVSWIRCPLDDDVSAVSLPPERLQRLEEYRFLGAVARGVFEGAGLRSADHFRGAALAWQVTREGAEKTLRGLPEGLTEYMVHPGYVDEEDAYAGPEREEELRILTDPATRRLLEQMDVALTHYGRL